MKTANNDGLYPPGDFAEIQAQAAKIQASGVLGRSRFYSALLQFLLESAKQGRTPKELEVADQVFQRGSDFDPSQDSVVRVYAHNLRQKIRQFYVGDGREEQRCLSITKGEYRLALVDRHPQTETPAVDLPQVAQSPRRRLALSATALALVAAGIVVGITVRTPAEAVSGQQASQYATVATSPLWMPVFDDDLPILIVVGDYFIFGELDARGDIQRLVREFSINSSHDLDELFMYEPDLMSQYTDLDLTYQPRSAAPALSDVLRIVHTSSKEARTISMSELNAADFKTHHVIYIGYLSGLDILSSFVFASSELMIGVTYDELVERATGNVYASNAGMAPDGHNYRDYGLLSTFPGPNGNQFIIVAGTRDTGLMQAAQAISNPTYLRAVEEKAQENGLEHTGAFEVLLEVTGFGRTNLDATIVHAASLDYGRIWGGDLPGGHFRGSNR
jgi:hypothetical protein